MINAIGAALQGLTTASKQVAESAEKIANPGDGSDLITDIVDLKVASASYKANLATLKTADKLSDDLLHIFDEKV